MLDHTMCTMTVKVYVDGVLVDEHINSEMPMYAVNYVAQCAVLQVQDPDLRAAKQCAEEHE